MITQLMIDNARAVAEAKVRKALEKFMSKLQTAEQKAPAEGETNAPVGKLLGS
jgi:hypothetical protein